MGIPFNPNAEAVTRLHMGNMLTFLVHQEVGDANRRFDQNFAGAAAGAFFLNRAEDRQGEAII